MLADIPVDVIKTGMLHTPAIISALAENLAERSTLIPLVIDPVMVAKGGAALMDRDAATVFAEQLLPQAYLLTPNIPEAERLLGTQISDRSGHGAGCPSTCTAWGQPTCWSRGGI